MPTATIFFGSKSQENGDLGKLVENVTLEVAAIVNAKPSYTGQSKGVIPVTVNRETYTIEFSLQTHTIGTQEIRLVNMFGEMRLAQYLQQTRKFFDELRRRGYENCPQI